MLTEPQRPSADGNQGPQDLADKANVGRTELPGIQPSRADPHLRKLRKLAGARVTL
jgi:hypothetical protein